jgi:BirA family transcriptional regulator, biotin operon repressor / biotin---[acetyl-CoA-carboxylase] ligase
LPLPSAGHSLGSPFIELQSVESTNNYALAQIHANLAQPGTCYFAHEQTAGKGQRGKSWATEKDANIIMTVVLRPGFLHLFQQFQLSACVAVATYQLLKKYAGTSVMIKWPNDLYWKDHKIGGVLIENVIAKVKMEPATWDWAVVGIGVNVNQMKFPSAIKKASSLKQITGDELDPLALAKELCATLDLTYKKLAKSGFASIHIDYNTHLYKKNEIVKFRRGNRVFEGTVKSVNETGQLIVENGIEEKFDFGEVEWVL